MSSQQKKQEEIKVKPLFDDKDQKKSTASSPEKPDNKIVYEDTSKKEDVKQGAETITKQATATVSAGASASEMKSNQVV